MNKQTRDEQTVRVSIHPIPLRLHYDEEAPYDNEDAATFLTGITERDGWERWSLPIGNGYFGANVFGRTETERIQITEKTLSNPYYRIDPNGKKISLGGLNNFSETYIDIGHRFSDVSDYSRWLDLETAISGVRYTLNSVSYTRECFVSYPDKAIVIRLDASEAGKLSFTLRPTVPWKQEYASWEGDRAFKTGQVVSYLDGKDGIIELSGKMGFYDVDFLGIYRVVTKDGQITPGTSDIGDGTIRVEGATSAYIYATLGSDYELTSEIFTAADTGKPTFTTTFTDTRIKVRASTGPFSRVLRARAMRTLTRS